MADELLDRISELRLLQRLAVDELSGSLYGLEVQDLTQTFKDAATRLETKTWVRRVTLKGIEFLQLTAAGLEEIKRRVESRRLMRE